MPANSTACAHRQSILLLALVLACSVSPGTAKEIVSADDGATSSLDRWVTSDPRGAATSWEIVQDADRGKVLRTRGDSEYQPTHRSPPNYALLRDAVVGDFTLTVDLQNTNPGAGPHRDLCLFFGFQDPEHFYYVHLGAVPDPHSCQIFIVNGSPRTKITENQPSGIPWTDGWSQVRIHRAIESGLIEVYFGDMDTPVMVAHDSTFGRGQVGLGTFDDHGNFNRFVLETP